ncbi:MAG TPA: 50S ribosomal protein L10 [Bacillota bacterium]|nr:50S ribosomal protein L10 [Bacillota bacterium]HOP69889.1 50S ribosomal protein L10 [Bacillota bacterium]HPT33944.1 50S ribosomal protein L10 [Bacillota bacterium]HQD07060.1 50S ribosomal protein L10 [Bacillota bacterium]
MKSLITRKQKEEIVQKMVRELEQAELIIAADYRGLNVSALNHLRRRLKEEQCRYQVVKNKLTAIACRRVGLEQLEQFLEGPTAMAFSAGDPVAAAKVFLDFSKENENFTIKGALLSGKLLAPEQVKALGEIPPREVLLAKMCGSFKAPLFGLVNVLQGNIRQLVYVLEAVRQKKESA